MLIVLDTSVFISALLGSTGASREVLSACLRGHLRPLMGAALFDIRDLRSGELHFPGLRILQPADLVKELEAWPH